MVNPPIFCPYSGVQCEGDPKQQDREINGEVAYIAEPNTQFFKVDTGIILFTDVGGIWHNSRLLADQFAAAGYLTVVCNYQGKVRAAGATIAETIHAPKTEPQEIRVVEDAIKYLRGRSCDKIGAVGYSEGAAWVMRLLGAKQVDAGFIAHPIEVTSQMLRKLTGPLSIAAADEDYTFGKPQRDESERILLNLGWPYQINLYSHVHHGFALRRAVTTKAEVYAKKQAFIQAVTWFNEHLLNGA